MKKLCSKCKTKKELKQFSRNRFNSDGYHHYCKSCKNKDAKHRYSTNEEYRLKRQRKQLNYLYALSETDYDQLLTNQNHSCAICLLPFESKRKTFVDHCHKSGKVRGLLCPKCNNLLGQCHDDTLILNSAIEYLTKI